MCGSTRASFWREPCGLEGPASGPPRWGLLSAVGFGAAAGGGAGPRDVRAGGEALGRDRCGQGRPAGRGGRGGGGAAPGRGWGAVAAAQLGIPRGGEQRARLRRQPGGFGGARGGTGGALGRAGSAAFRLRLAGFIPAGPGILGARLRPVTTGFARPAGGTFRFGGCGGRTLVAGLGRGGGGSSRRRGGGTLVGRRGRAGDGAGGPGNAGGGAHVGAAGMGLPIGAALAGGGGDAVRRGDDGHARGQFKVHLLLEPVHLRHLDGDAVAQLNDAAGAAADDAAAHAVELVKIILDRGQGHGPAEAEVGHVHKEAEIAHIRDQAGVRWRLVAGQLFLQEGVHFHVLAVALRVGGIAFGGGQLVGDFVEGGGAQPLGRFAEERAVDEQVGVAPDGRGEMGVFLLGQAVVAERFDRVPGAHERAQEADLEGGADGHGGEFAQELLHLGADGEVAAGQVVGHDFGAVFPQPSFIRSLVDPVDRGTIQGHEAGRDGFVGQEHELLDQLMGDVVVMPFDAQHPALVIQPDFGFRKIHFQRTGREPRSADELRHFVGLVQHFFDGIGGLALQHRQGFLIGKAPLGMNHGRVKLRAHHAAVGGEQELHAFGQAIHPGFERAQLVAEALGQHGDDAVHQVGGVAPLPGLGVQGGPGPDVMRHIGDVDPQFPLPVGGGLEANGVVKILGVIGVDGHDGMVAAIGAPGQFVRANLLADGNRFGEDALGKMVGQAVLAEHGEHVHAGFGGGAQHLHDFALGADVPGFPGAQIDEHLVPRLGLGPGAREGRDVDIVRNPGVVGDHVQKLFAVAQGADQLGAGTFQDADHLARALALIAAFAGGDHVQTRQDTIAVEGGAGGVLGDGDFTFPRRVTLHEAFPLAVDPDAAGHQVGVQGEDKPVVFNAGHAAGALELSQDALEGGKLRRRQSQGG